MLIKEGKTDWNLLLIAVVLAAIAGAGVFDFTGDIVDQIASLSDFPKIKGPDKVVKDETANWKIFENQEYGFQIKYPEGWNYGPNILRSSKEPHMIFCPPELIDLESDRGCKWYTQATGFTDTLSPILLFVEDWNNLRGETKDEKKNIAWCKFEEKKTINGIEMEFIDCDGQKRVYWENPSGSHLYKFFLKNSEFSTEFRQMLSTFRFLD